MIQEDSDVTTRLYRSYAGLKIDIRADEQELNHRFEQAMDAIRRRHSDSPPRRALRTLNGAIGLSTSLRSRAVALTAVVLTTAVGALQGALGALLSLLSSALVSGAVLATIQHSTPRAHRSGRS
jgi:hypothetical protein